ncbi:MAG: hypothetical protein WC307_06240 [Candidatus Nanoarchaeia archaeon]|jgi:hypothetical protein
MVRLKDFEYNDGNNITTGENWTYILSLRDELLAELKQLNERLEALGTGGCLSDYDYGELKGKIDFLNEFIEPTKEELGGQQ